GLATCNLQTTSPSGFLNNFNLKILSNFLGSVQTEDSGYFPFLKANLLCFPPFCSSQKEKNEFCIFF
ncbi:hypothetical protein, partial [Anaerotignum lactatifermentans]|uniref:hypothetical protein n=1 Tax=Anaerotignum lactatifermentans TaxID=160404 RepID=UPI00255CE227